jgi:phosphatidylserine/phosphatidylglycerophosphate/cardiolipin synthase-like enzyme
VSPRDDAASRAERVVARSIVHRHRPFLALCFFAALGACNAVRRTEDLDAGAMGDDAAPSTDDAWSSTDDAATVPEDAWVAPTPDTGPSGTTGLRVIVEPSDGGAGLVAAISAATASVHMTMYLLTSREVIDALVARHRAGVEVRVVLNQTFPSGTSTSNDSAYTQLTSAGIPVHWAPSAFTLTHEKCVILDGREAWIMTMNATLTSPTSNREFLLIDDEPAHVADAERIFEGDFAGSPITSYAGPLVLAPTDAAAPIHALIAGALHTIDVEDEELSDRDTVAALVGAAGRGVRVRVVLSDGTRTAAGDTAVSNLRAAGIPVHTVSTPYIHAKAIVVDGARTFVGSENLTFASLTMNRELGVIFSQADVVSTVASTIASDFASGTAL